ncbi:hypothetical protein KKH23_10090 [Patescibacteria group bacterium]|uniref:Uncharacterized protein n=1 Tax=viral metagenome TaxID=1070528 RepID=A0A6M3M0Q7_9ZZZZ|nr:hypothetical protein [Patescibacteria group bacterium]MBU0847522.1 hypothetical protein [Patescibacteria group bacterium]
MLIEIKQIKFKELAAAVKVLNDSGFLKEAIPTVGQSKEAIVRAFVRSVQAIPDDADGNWTGPAEVADYYEKIVILPPPAVVAEEKKEKNEKAKKEPKEKKELKEKIPKEKSVSSIDLMKELLAKKTSDAEITKVFTEKFQKKDPKVTADFVEKRIKIYKNLAK